MVSITEEFIKFMENPDEFENIETISDFYDKYDVPDKARTDAHALTLLQKYHGKQGAITLAETSEDDEKEDIKKDSKYFVRINVRDMFIRRDFNKPYYEIKSMNFLKYSFYAQMMHKKVPKKRLFWITRSVKPVERKEQLGGYSIQEDHLDKIRTLNMLQGHLELIEDTPEFVFRGRVYKVENGKVIYKTYIQ